jgi:hypothetical protein
MNMNLSQALIADARSQWADMRGELPARDATDAAMFLLDGDDFDEALLVERDALVAAHGIEAVAAELGKHLEV